MKHLRVSHHSESSLWHFPTQIALFFLVQGLLKWTYLQISYPGARALLTCIGNRQTFPECELWNGSCMDVAQTAHVGTRVPALPCTYGFTWHSELWWWPRCLEGICPRPHTQRSGHVGCRRCLAAHILTCALGQHVGAIFPDVNAACSQRRLELSSLIMTHLLWLTDFQTQEQWDCYLKASQERQTPKR